MKTSFQKFAPSRALALAALGGGLFTGPDIRFPKGGLLDSVMAVAADVLAFVRRKIKSG